MVTNKRDFTSKYLFYSQKAFIQKTLINSRLTLTINFCKRKL